METKSILIINNTSDNKAKKEKLLSNFKKLFFKKTKVATPKEDPFDRLGYGIDRSDLVRMVALLSDDVILNIDGQKTTLQKFLQNLLIEGQSNKINDFKRRIWIEFGYGASIPIVNNVNPDAQVIIPSSNELQLVITAVTNGLTPAPSDIGVGCFTTASMSGGGRPIEPPFSVPIHPQN